MRFPAVTLFHRSNWQAQPRLTGDESKCFVGSFDSDAPNCDSVTMESLTGNSSCSCNSSWSPQVGDFYEWQGSFYHYLTFAPPPKLIALRPTIALLLQAFFTCRFRIRTRNAKNNDGQTTQLALWNHRAKKRVRASTWQSMILLST